MEKESVDVREGTSFFVEGTDIDTIFSSGRRRGETRTEGGRGSKGSAGGANGSSWPEEEKKEWVQLFLVQFEIWGGGN